MVTAEVLAKSSAADWRPLAPERTLYLDLASGRVVIELATEFAPVHVANVQMLARQQYLDGLAIVRVQDNYVTQWAIRLRNATWARSIGTRQPSSRCR